MEVLIVGLVVGIMMAFAFIMLVEKAGPTLKALLIGHYLFTDIVATMISFSIFPVVGLATLATAGAFCLIFTFYLHQRRKTVNYITLPQLIKRSLKR